MTNEAHYFIGTCGYSYPGLPPNGWSGVFYPKAGRTRVDELEFYAAHFNCVEINSTFYRPAGAAMARGWLAKTPADFIFTAKVWQKFTHPTELGRDGKLPGSKWTAFDKTDVARFGEGIAPLAAARRLGALLFQYPASFSFEAANVERLESALANFTMAPKVVELRHKSWSDRRDETEALLGKFNATWAFIDEPKFPSSVHQEIAAQGNFNYLRLHGRNREKWWRPDSAWERYDYFYQPENIHRLAAKLKQLGGQAPTAKSYVFFNNHARGQAVANAFMLKLALGLDDGAAPPESLVKAFPALADFRVRPGNR
jgi:uncharacterized protein YecE (DUF72 family)